MTLAVGIPYASGPKACRYTTQAMCSLIIFCFGGDRRSTAPHEQQPQLLADCLSHRCNKETQWTNTSVVFIPTLTLPPSYYTVLNLKTCCFFLPAEWDEQLKRAAFVKQPLNPTKTRARSPHTLVLTSCTYLEDSTFPTSSLIFKKAKWLEPH